MKPKTTGIPHPPGCQNPQESMSPHNSTHPVAAIAGIIPPGPRRKVAIGKYVLVVENDHSLSWTIKPDGTVTVTAAHAVSFYDWAPQPMENA